MKKKILIVSGGISKERIISLDTGRQVAKELKKEINYSKKTLTEYFQIIKKQENIKYITGMKPLWNMFTGEMKYWPEKVEERYPWNSYPINRMSEILVDLPFMKKHYFVNI